MGNALSKITESFAIIAEAIAIVILFWSIGKCCLWVWNCASCLFANRETIVGAVKQGKEVIDVASQYAPTVWGRIKQYVIKVRMEVAYVISREDTEQKGYVLVIDVKTRKCIRKIEVGVFPSGIAITQDRKRMYVVNRDSNTVSVIDTEKNQVIATIDTEVATTKLALHKGVKPEKIAITPNGERIYVTRPGNHTVIVFARENSLIGTEKYEWMTTIRVGKDPQDLAVTADGREVYVANSGDRTVTVINTSDNTITTTIPMNDQPQRVYVTPDENTWVYILNENSVTMIDSGRKQTTTILEGIHPERAVFNQKGNRFYLTISAANHRSDHEDYKVLIVNVGRSNHGYIYGEIALKRRSQAIALSADEDWICTTHADSHGATRIDPVMEEIVEEIADDSDHTNKNFEKIPLKSGIPLRKIRRYRPDLSKKWQASVVPKVEEVVNAHRQVVGSSSNQAPPNPGNADEEVAITSDGKTAFVTNSTVNQLLCIDRGDEQTDSDAKPIPMDETPSKVLIASIVTNETECKWNRIILMTLFLCFTMGIILLSISGNTYSIYALYGTTGIPIFLVVMPILLFVSIIKFSYKVKQVLTVVAGFLFCAAILVIVQLYFVENTNTPTGYTAYISDFKGNVIWGMDTATNRTTARIEVGAGPDSLAVASGATEIWVANWLNGTVSVVDTRSNSVTATIPVGTGPRNVTVSPSGGHCWISNQFNRSVSVVDMATKQVVATIEVEAEPGAMEFTVDEAKVCVVNVGSGTVSIIDTKTYNVTKIDVGQLPESIVMDHDSDEKWTYVTSIGNHSVVVIDVTYEEDRVKIIPVGGDPRGLALIPEKQRLYVSIFNAGIVSVIDTSGDTIVANISVRSGPHILLLSPNHSRLYVGNELSSSISVIDTETTETGGKVIATIIGLRNSFLRSMAITSDGSQIYVTYKDSGWISIIDIKTVDKTTTYVVRNVEVGTSLREVVFVKK
jgi:YVTN family beta-propeller protein